MPKIVDHEQRRLEIIRATWRVISREGIANATTRQIAKEAGFSSGVLAHYFRDKRDIMANAMLAAHTEVSKRIAASREVGLGALRQYMLECLPLDNRRVQLAAIEVSFWGMAVADQELIELNTQENANGFRARITRMLSEAMDLGQIDPATDVKAVVRELHVLMDGLSAQAAIYARSATRAEQTAMLDAILDRIRQ